MRNRAVKIQFWFWTKIFCHQDREVVILFTSVFSCLLLKKMPLPSSFFFFFLFFFFMCYAWTLGTFQRPCFLPVYDVL